MRSPSLLALLGSALLLCACGGGGGDVGDEAEIRTVIEASATSPYPADCTRYATLNFLEQGTKMRGRPAVVACEETTLEASVPDAVRSRDIEVDGERATAQVAFEGGPSGGQTFEVALVEVGEQWKLHELLSFVVFDREQLILEMGRQGLEQARSAADVDFATCIIGALERLSDADLEALVLDPSQEPLYEVVRPCVPRSATA